MEIMSVFCICGVCVPYNAIWPFLLLALRPIWDWLKKVLGMESKSSTCDDAKGSCCSSADKAVKKKSGTFPEQHFALAEAENLPGMWTEGVRVLRWVSPAPLYSITLIPHLLSIFLLLLPPAILDDASMTVLKFTATWCKPCKKIEPAFGKTPLIPISHLP